MPIISDCMQLNKYIYTYIVNRVWPNLMQEGNIRKYIWHFFPTLEQRSNSFGTNRKILQVSDETYVSFECFSTYESAKKERVIETIEIVYL